jgi:hypothetical protein
MVAAALPIQGVAWRSNAELGTTEKNEAPGVGFWIYLKCEPSPHPRLVCHPRDLDGGHRGADRTRFEGTSHRFSSQVSTATVRKLVRSWRRVEAHHE